MIRKNVQRFSEKIMRGNNLTAMAIRTKAVAL